MAAILPTTWRLLPVGMVGVVKTHLFGAFALLPVLILPATAPYKTVLTFSAGFLLVLPDIAFTKYSPLLPSSATTVARYAFGFALLALFLPTLYDIHVQNTGLLSLVDPVEAVLVIVLSATAVTVGDFLLWKALLSLRQRDHRGK